MRDWLQIGENYSDKENTVWKLIYVDIVEDNKLIAKNVLHPEIQWKGTWGEFTDKFMRLK